MAKILIVDDSEALRTQLRKTLESKSHQVVEGVDGINGFEVLEQNKDVQLILCDVNMPRLDGLGLCEKIHAHPEFSEIPIMMLTTEANPAMKTRGKEAGVLAWITKPYVDDKLLAAVEKVVAMKK